MLLGDLSLAVLSSSALLGLTVLLLLTGRIVPRSTLRDRIDESERWRSAYEAEREARSLSDAHTVELLEVAKTTQAIILAIAKASETIRAGGTDAIQKK